MVDWGSILTQPSSVWVLIVPSPLNKLSTFREDAAYLAVLLLSLAAIHHPCKLFGRLRLPRYPSIEQAQPRPRDILQSTSGPHSLVAQAIDHATLNQLEGAGTGKDPRSVLRCWALRSTASPRSQAGSPKVTTGASCRTLDRNDCRQGSWRKCGTRALDVVLLVHSMKRVRRFHLTMDLALSPWTYAAAAIQGHPGSRG